MIATRPARHSDDPTPALIRRNTLLLAVAQGVAGASNNFVFTLGPLMVVAMTGSATLAGLVVALFGVSRFVAAYPFGRITDVYGRRPGVIVSLVVAIAGALMIAFGGQTGGLVLFLGGMLVYSAGMNGVQQMRLAAAEMYPPHRRAVMIGWLLTGSLAGIVLSPALVSLGGAIAPSISFDPLAAPWLLVPLLAVPGAVLVWLIHPDPKDIAMHLVRYFPSYHPSHEEVGAIEGAFGPRRFFADARRRLAALAMFSAQGSMQIAMVTAPLSMAHHGSALPAIALSMSLHTAGMFGPSVPMGWLTEWFGRQRVLVAGTLVEAVGGGVTAFASEHALITVGVILVGLGWCAANVSSTTMIVDSTPPNARGASIGLTDSIAAAGGVIFPLSVGPLLDLSGIGATGVLAMLLMVPPLAMLALRGRR